MKKYVSPIPFLKTIQEMLPSVILSASVQDVGPREGDTRSWITVAPDNVFPVCLSVIFPDKK